MKIFLRIIGACFLLFSCTGEHATVHRIKPVLKHSLSEELKVFYDISSLPEYFDGTLCAEVSSYDTTWKNDDGFNGKYSFISRNTDSSLVIFDVSGGGVINRIWTATPTLDTLDFFIDNDLKPLFSISFIDLFSGNRFPFTAPLCGNQLGGYYCYLPIPFEKSCKIVSRGKKMQFHQIQYRMYEKGSGIKSFTPALNEEEKEELKKIASLWNSGQKSIHDFYSGGLSESSAIFEIKPGKTKTVFEYGKGGRILGIEFKPAGEFEGPDKNVDLKITWDGELNPAVYCPAADFFGYAFGKGSMQSLLLGSKDNITYCYFPMPFDKSAKIELINRITRSSLQKPVNISVRIWYSSEKRVAEQEGKFYAQWNRNLRSQAGKPHTFLDVSGKGHYIGTILQAQGMRAGMTYFFEGDDSTSIDGIFRMHGTGSEDYFNGGWYAMMDRWDGKMSLPLHGSLDYSLPFCRTGGYRLFLSDKISFEKSFYHSIEHGPAGNQFPVDYSSMGFYYSDSPVKIITEPTGELSNIFIPDTLIMYPQLMDYNIFGNMDIKTTWKYGTGGESYLFTPGNDSWLRVSLKEIPEGDYALFCDIVKEPYGCDFSLWQRQKSISDWSSTYNKTEERLTGLYVCDIAVNEFDKSLTFRFRTDNKRSSLLLNTITLVRKQAKGKL